jgi:hypothetical protein
MGTELCGVSAHLQGAWMFTADKTLLHYHGSRELYFMIFIQVHHCNTQIT